MLTRIGLVGIILFIQINTVIAMNPQVVEGQFIVRLEKGIDIGQIHDLLDVVDAQEVETLVPQLDLYLVTIKPGRDANFILPLINKHPLIKYAQPDHKVTMRKVPNDPEFSKLWSLKNTTLAGADIGAESAWELGTGGKDKLGNDIVIAIVDGGVDVRHPDLVANIWTNTGEIAGNGVDDDGNGYIDDIHGWNAYSSEGSLPANYHGTHVSGIAGAVGDNGLDIVGVNWNVKIMGVAGSSGQTSVISRAYGYVLKQKELWLETKGKKGANIVATNSSFGVDYGKCETEEYKVWNDLYDAMGAVGILSMAATANINIDIDEVGDVPTGCSSPHIISVTNTTIADKKNSSAAYGLTTIDLGAPGTNILSTTPSASMGKATGTSMATPHVTGAVAFLHSVASKNFAENYQVDPGKAALDLKNVLLETVDQIDDLKGRTVTGGRLNLARAATVMSKIKGAEILN